MVDWHENKHERVSDYLYAALLVAMIMIAAQALLRSDDRDKAPMTVEAVLTPAPIPEPAPAAEPRPRYQ